MRIALLAVGTLAAALLVGCNDTPVHPVNVPHPEDPAAYKPVPAPKPMPGNGGGDGQPQPAPRPMPGPSAPPAGPPPAQ
jgi:hypothetical protein